MPFDIMSLPTPFRAGLQRSCVDEICARLLPSGNGSTRFGDGGGGDAEGIASNELKPWATSGRRTFPVILDSINEKKSQGRIVIST
jgi:hypothetical protein